MGSCFVLLRLSSWISHKAKLLTSSFQVDFFQMSKRNKSKQHKRKRKRNWRDRFCCSCGGTLMTRALCQCWDKSQVLFKSSGQWHNKTALHLSKICHIFFNTCTCSNVNTIFCTFNNWEEKKGFVGMPTTVFREIKVEEKKDLLQSIWVAERFFVSPLGPKTLT